MTDTIDHHQDKAVKKMYWQTVLLDWQESNRTVTQYCRDKNLPYHTFKYWKNRLCDKTASETTYGSSTSASFIEIALTDNKEPVSLASKDSLIKITTPNGYEVALGNYFDEFVLKKLFRVLGEAPC